EPGDTIIILDNNQKIGEVVVGENGTWEFTPETALGDGDHAISIIIQDPAGNQSEPSDSQVITIDTWIAKPTILDVIDDVGSIKGSIANNGVTDDNKPTLSGNAEAGSTVTVKNGNTVLGSVVADASGNWSFTPSTALADGQ
ncbi:Ig-like domain-containing protein, partial [Aeromonas hydrophila]|uniref:Ig-like domain-containing protein n=1 Tax=Aeromonas hydrophila TaxID=644 RepID=UPI0022AFE935